MVSPLSQVFFFQTDERMLSILAFRIPSRTSSAVPERNTCMRVVHTVIDVLLGKQKMDAASHIGMGAPENHRDLQAVWPKAACRYPQVSEKMGDA